MVWYRLPCQTSRWGVASSPKEAHVSVMSVVVVRVHHAYHLHSHCHCDFVLDLDQYLHWVAENKTQHASRLGTVDLDHLGTDRLAAVHGMPLERLGVAVQAADACHLDRTDPFQVSALSPRLSELVHVGVAESPAVDFACHPHQQVEEAEVDEAASVTPDFYVQAGHVSLHHGHGPAHFDSDQYPSVVAAGILQVNHAWVVVKHFAVLTKSTAA